jgi:RHS repeat-associated protein
MIRAGNSTIIVSRQSGGTNTSHYVTSDHLGSSSAITNGAGAIVVNSSFDAFGKRRGSSWTGSPSSGDWTAIAATTRRGYTDHSMLDNVALVHMNGRVQDPVLGRFLRADPFIAAPLDTQNYNRYSYVSNRPLTFTDPSGFCEEGEEEVVVMDSEVSDGRKFECRTVVEVPGTRPTRDPIAVVNPFGGFADSFIDLDFLTSVLAVGLTSSEADTKQSTEEKKSRCYAPFSGGDSFLSQYAARVGNMFAGLLDSVSAQGMLGLTAGVNGNFLGLAKVNISGTAAFNANLNVSAAGHVDLFAKVPMPGNFVFGEANASIGSLQFGNYASYVRDGISTRNGPYEAVFDGAAPAAKYAVWKSDLGKISASAQFGIGVKVQVDFFSAARAIDCALKN